MAFEPSASARSVQTPFIVREQAFLKSRTANFHMFLVVRSQRSLLRQRITHALFIIYISETVNPGAGGQNRTLQPTIRFFAKLAA